MRRMGGADGIGGCAAELDLAYLGEGAPITGAHQGHYIFIDAAAI